MYRMTPKVIQEIGERMATQDNRGNVYPIFVIKDEESVNCEHYEDWERRERKDSCDVDDICGQCLSLDEEGKDMPEECDRCGNGAFYYYRKAEKFDLQAGFFLTEEACHAHLATNKHHYNTPRSYVISAWRNPELQAVMRHLVQVSLKPTPSHYQ